MDPNQTAPGKKLRIRKTVPSRAKMSATHPGSETSRPYGRVKTAAELGAICRAERTLRGLTLAEVYATTALSTRFLSEFERGKEHASIGRALRVLHSLGLDILVVPRARAERLQRALRQEDESGSPP